jgi:diacylglycerol diphosphate phosphatase/phosphatidate phosphatase
MGHGYALATSTLFISLIKIFVGGLRPHFLTLCAPNIPPSSPPPYTADQVCSSSVKASHLKEAQMSFPSGHANAAFAGFGFLALYLNAKFKCLGNGDRFRDHYGNGERRDAYRVRHWKMLLFALPWLIAVLLALSKVRDG